MPRLSPLMTRASDAARRARPRAWLQGPAMRIVMIAMRVSPLLAGTAALTVVLNGALPTIYTLASARLVGSIPGAVEGGFESAAGGRLVLSLVIVGVVYTAQLSLLPVFGLAVSALTRRVDRHVAERVMRAILRPTGIGHLEDPSMQDDVAKASGLVGGTSPGMAISALVSRWGMRASGAGAFAILVGFRWWVAVGLVATLLGERQFWRRRYDDVTAAFFDTGQVHRRSAWYRDAALLPTPSKEVRAFGLDRWLRDRQQQSWDEAMVPVWQKMRGRPVDIVFNALWPIAPHAIAYALLARAAWTGDVSLTAAVAFAQSIVNVQGLAATGDVDRNISAGLAALPVALDLEERLARPEFTSPGTRDASALPREEIRFENVSFRYRGREEDVYSGLDLTIAAGRSLAIVGANGAGKTTLVKLLARLYEPTSGQITVDGIDIAELDPCSWQTRIAAIFQDYHRYDLPARDNVGFGAPHIAGDVEALDRVAARAGAQGVVESLPDGWDTPLSRQLTGGTDLSGGQWQRLALARALFAVEGGASVLVLDEPSANLDVRAEADLYDRFLDVTRGLTTIVISHRFSTVRRADRIVVVDHGRITESGTHDDLVAIDGTYARMFALQASRYEEAMDA